MEWCTIFLNLESPSWIPSHTPQWWLNPYYCLHITFWKIWIPESSHWTSTSTCILPGTQEQSLERPTICHCLSGWHNYLQQNCRRHLDHLQQVFHKLQNAKLSMKLSKCHFFAKEIQYLGHILSTADIKPIPSKTETIKIMWPLKNTKQVQTFLGLVGYYQKVIKIVFKLQNHLQL